MSDWQVGDLAVCVNTKRCACGCLSPALIQGAVFRVSQVIYDSRATGGVALNFEGISPGHHNGFGAIRFRKIRPDEHEACEPEFVTLLKRTKVRA